LIKVYQFVIDGQSRGTKNDGPLGTLGTLGTLQDSKRLTGASLALLLALLASLTEFVRKITSSSEGRLRSLAKFGPGWDLTGMKN
jgi:hypothetical protein